MDLLDALDEIEQQAMAGGTITAKMRLEVGQGFLLPGTPGHETFWSFELGKNKEGSAESIQKAKEDCLADIAERGLDGSDEDKPRKWPNLEYHLVVYKNSVKGNAGESWQDDRHFIYPYWGGHSEPAVNVRRVVDEVLRPAIKELGITKFPNEFWGELAFRPDPTGRMGTDANDEERVELVAYPSKRYANEAEAEAAAASVNNSDANLTEKKKKYIEDEYKAAIKAGKDSDEAIEEIASDWNVSVDAVKGVVG
jgi:hypothetical protein